MAEGDLVVPLVAFGDQSDQKEQGQERTVVLQHHCQYDHSRAASNTRDV
jgi:hypothetical protein